MHLNLKTPPSLCPAVRFGSLNLLALAGLLLAGCSSLPFGKKEDDSAASAPEAAASAAQAQAKYRLDIQAPGPLKKLLATYLDLARFQKATAADAVDAVELETIAPHRAGSSPLAA